MKTISAIFPCLGITGIAVIFNQVGIGAAIIVAGAMLHGFLFGLLIWYLKRISATLNP